MAEWLTLVPRVREVESSTANTYTALQTVRHHFNIYKSSCVALALWQGVGRRKHPVL